MVQEGLRENGRWPLARSLAQRYASAVVETFVRQRDITENLAPDQPLACGVGKFVGWGGIGPIANLIEYLLGFDIDVPQKRITWRIGLTEKHGLKNLRLAQAAIDLICEARSKESDPCRITVSASGPFTLWVFTPSGQFDRRITPGQHQFTIK
jgi:hypothetical protein